MATEDEMTTKLAVKEKELDNIKQDGRAFQRNVGNTLLDLLDDNVEFNNTIATLSTQNENLQNQVNVLSQEKVQLESEVRSLQGQVSQMKQENTQSALKMGQDMAKLTKDNEDYLHALRQFTIANESLTEYKNNLLDQLEQSKKENAKLEGLAVDNEQLKEQLAAALAKNARLETKHADLKRKWKAVTNHMNLEAAKLDDTSEEDVEMEDVSSTDAKDEPKVTTHPKPIATPVRRRVSSSSGTIASSPRKRRISSTGRAIASAQTQQGTSSASRVMTSTMTRPPPPPYNPPVTTYSTSTVTVTTNRPPLPPTLPIARAPGDNYHYVSPVSVSPQGRVID